mmetsp:Transcript_10438/g.63812  ORF Transcript_10438/g.63812 Transcript_10438/m.63812 type:complete len:119 (-) Transcript_10438:4589-4945(-)
MEIERKDGTGSYRPAKERHMREDGEENACTAETHTFRTKMAESARANNPCSRTQAALLFHGPCKTWIAFLFHIKPINFPTLISKPMANRCTSCSAALSSSVALVGRPDGTCAALQMAS